MRTTKCPVCDEMNEVGPATEVKPGERFPTMELCEHHWFDIYTDPVWDYLASQLYIELGYRPGLSQYHDQIEAILKQYWLLTKQAAFVRSQKDRDAAEKRVREFLKSVGLEA